MFAGHESSALTLDFLLIMLACHPETQVALQSDLDRIIGDADPADWSYEKHFRPLSNGYVGAIINEISRLFTVLPYLSKTSPATPYSMNLVGKQHSIPAKTLMFLNTSAVHRHPGFWPTSFKRDAVDVTNIPDPVASFNLQHWLSSSPTEAAAKQTDAFLRPQPGSFIPFSEGHRGCLGKRFALVELTAIVSRIFKNYKVELAIDCGSDALSDEYTRLWKTAREEAERAMSASVEFRISLRRTAKVPLRFVKRSEATMC